MIHPTAVVSPDARLGKDTTVGPYAIIEAGAEIGDRCTISAHATVTGRASMGTDNFIGHGAVIGGEPQDLHFAASTDTRVVIGNRNQIREFCTLHRATTPGSATRVGDDNLLMVGAHLGHDVILGNKVILANNVALGGHVVMEDGVFVGGGTLFHQFVKVGRLAICQGDSGFSKSVPPYTCVAFRNAVVGLNVIGMRRAGIGPEARADIKRAFRALYRSGQNVDQALEAARAQSWFPEASHFWEFVAHAGKRGICALQGRNRRRTDNADA